MNNGFIKNLIKAREEVKSDKELSKVSQRIKKEWEDELLNDLTIHYTENYYKDKEGNCLPDMVCNHAIEMFIDKIILEISGD